jgi:purine nucleoside phosphorylase
MAAGVLDAPINHEDVLAMGERTRENFTALLEAIVDGIRDQSPEAL